MGNSKWYKVIEQQCFYNRPLSIYPNVYACVYIYSTYGTLKVLVVSVLCIGKYSYLVCKVLIIPNMKCYPIKNQVNNSETCAVNSSFAKWSRLIDVAVFNLPYINRNL